MSGHDADVDPSAIVASTTQIRGRVILGREALINDFVTFYPNVRIGADVEIFEGAVVGKPPKGTTALARKVSSEAKLTTVDRYCVISEHANVFKLASTSTEASAVGEMIRYAVS